MNTNMQVRNIFLCMYVHTYKLYIDLPLGGYAYNVALKNDIMWVHDQLHGCIYAISM